MTRTLGIVLALAAVALAGCSDDSGPAAPDCDPKTHFLDARGVCNPHVEPRLFVDGLPVQVEQYFPISFTWTLDNGTRGTTAQPVHSMDSRVLASMEDMQVTNQTGPDDFGVEVARQEHKNLPAGPFEAQFRWEDLGTVYIKGYMRIDGEHVWQDMGTVEVNPVQATGAVSNVTIGQGPPPGLSESQTGITVGGAVRWINENQLYGYTITFECTDGVTMDPVDVPSDGASASVAFLAPTSCDYTASTGLSGSGVSQGDLEGTINVNRP